MLALSYDDAPEDRSLESELRRTIALTARVPTIAAHAFAAKRHYYDQEGVLYLHRPQEGLSVAENFLWSVRHDNQFTQEEAKLLDLCLVLHAEHGGGNNPPSPAGCLLLRDRYLPAISVAIGSLKGPPPRRRQQEGHGDVRLYWRRGSGTGRTRRKSALSGETF